MQLRNLFITHTGPYMDCGDKFPTFNSHAAVERKIVQFILSSSYVQLESHSIYRNSAGQSSCAQVGTDSTYFHVTSLAQTWQQSLTSTVYRKVTIIEAQLGYK